MAQTLRPVSTDPISTEQQFSDQFLRETGIVFDDDGTSLKVTADGSSTTVTVAAGQALLRGLMYESDANEAVALGSLGTQPTSGQERFSRIVLRLNLSAFTAAITAITGSPAATGSAVVPAYVRDSSSYDFTLATVRQVGALAITQADITDERSHTGDHRILLPGAPLDLLYIGQTRRQSGSVYSRVLTGTTVETLRVRDADEDPLRRWNWGADPYSTSPVSGDWRTPPGASRSYTLKGGHLYHLESRLFLVAPSVSAFRTRSSFGNTQVEERSGRVGTTGQEVLVSGYFRPTITTTYTVTCQVRVEGGVRIESDLSPTSTLVDLGYRES